MAGNRRGVTLLAAFSLGAITSSIVASFNMRALDFDIMFAEQRATAVECQCEEEKGADDDDDDDEREEEQVAEEQKSFTDLLIESGSDKFKRHHYERYYTKWLEPYRSKRNVKLLEIGAERGRSLKLWHSYFDDPALILGLAYGASAQNVDSVAMKLDRAKVHFGDQSKKETMDYLKKKGPWDIIIDDGSHVPQHVLISLFSLWSSIKPGGMYVIEDLETSYWESGSMIYGYQLNHTGIGVGPEYSVVSKLEQIQQVLVRHQIGSRELSVMPGDHDICSVEWGMNLVVLRKCEDDGKPKPPYLKPVYDADLMRKWIKKAQRTNPSMTY
jgi:hypothetical protein